MFGLQEIHITPPLGLYWLLNTKSFWTPGVDYSRVNPD